ncbi:hypothetical protein ACFOW1_03600 [Parasediminibacterium paludis]|uniref:Rop protein n=1 Tax=Parasediminibacterium paludis TaxID=908966 RepID=A0ABV8PUN2_9BACT
MENEKKNDDELENNSLESEQEMVDDYLGSCTEAMSILYEIDGGLLYNGTERISKLKEQIFDIMEHEVQRMHNDLFKEKSGEG